MSELENVKPDKKDSSGGFHKWLSDDEFRLFKWTGQTDDGTFFGTLSDWRIDRERPALIRLRTAIHCPVCGWHDDLDAKYTSNQQKRLAAKIARDITDRQLIKVIEM